MKSTDHNINNPLNTVELDLLRTVDSWHMPTCIGVTQEEYDLMQIHDPNTIYSITDSEDYKAYIGDILIEKPCNTNKYYMTINSRHEYVIYVDELAFGKYMNGNSKLTPICCYDDPQSAIDAISKFNKIGSHIQRDSDIYDVILSYIDKNISTHELIISIIILYNFREDPRLQNIIEFAVAHEAHQCMKEFPPFYADQITRMRDQKPESLFPIYSNLYDLMVKYNFFNDKKYQDINNLDLSKEIKDIGNTVLFRGYLQI